METEALPEIEVPVRKTGKCKVCHVDIATHPKCGGCAVLTGIGHHYFSILFRGHNLCNGCINKWEKLDKLVDREATWDEFLGSISPRCLDE